MNWSNHFLGGFGEGRGQLGYRVTQEPAMCLQLQLLGLLTLQAPFPLCSYAGELQSKHQKQCQLYTVLMGATLNFLTAA